MGLSTSPVSESPPGILAAIDQATAWFKARGSISGCWDLNREQLSLGGLLVLRSELEHFAAMAQVARISVYFRGEADSVARAFASPLLSALASKYAISLAPDAGEPRHWPAPEQLAAPTFSYQHFDRCGNLFRASGVRPGIGWSAEVLESARSLRAETRGKLFTVHLKQVPGQTAEESNSDLDAWRVFLRTYAEPARCEFVLLGDDLPSEEIARIPGIQPARDRKIPLPVQLALIGLSDGFIGMASGICAAAVLSGVAYVIFKNPRHHPAEMARELGTADSFSFALPMQKLWRKTDSQRNLAEGFNIINGGSQ